MLLSTDLLFSLVPLSVLLMFILLPFKWLSSFYTQTHKNSPPTARKLPVIGNLYQLGSTPHRYLRNLAKKHGPLMLIHLGSAPVLVASTPKTAQEILKTHDLAFCNRPKSSISHIITYGSKDIAFAPYGEYWRQIKTISMVQLLSNKRVHSFRKVREEETLIMIEKIEESRGSLVDLSGLVGLVTNNVICRVALGKTYRGLKFKDLMRRFTHLLGVFSVGSYIPWLSWMDRLSGLENEAKKVAEEFDEFLEGVLEEHISKRRKRLDFDDGSEKDKENQDLVDILLDVQSENITVDRDTIKAVIMDMFIAGTDTTSTSIEWAISELLKHPHVMKKLQQEAKEAAQEKPMITEQDLRKMPYLKSVIKETLRLHPPVPLLVPREARKDVNIMGYEIEKGTQVIINAWAIGRDASLWKEPEKFIPERFLESSIDYKGFHFELLPFGSGRRGCPGIQFAISVNELVLANLVYKFDLESLGEEIGEELDMSETNGLVLQKKFPLLVIATPRF